MKKTRLFMIATTVALLMLFATTFLAITVSAEVVTDVTGPTITEAYCDKQGQVLKPGDTAYFSFKAYDESGLRDRVSVNFYEATSYSGRSFNWVYNSSEGKYETTFTVPETAKNGEYYISTIYMYDIHGNQTALSTHLGFRVEGSISDTNGPTITEAYCDKQEQVLKPGDTVYFSFKAYDESGLRDRVSVNFYEATSYSGRSFNWVYNSNEDKYETTFTVPSSVKMGAYYISTIYMYDIHGNQTALSTHLGFYVEPDGHNFGNWSKLDSNNHKRICSICQKIETELHSGGSSTCTELAKCDICHQSYGSYSEHAGGTATCTVKAKCDVCNQSYGTFGQHDFDKTSWGYKNADGHANSCQTSGCSEHNTVIAHTPGGAATEDVAETCTECGYIISPALGHKKHTAKTEWSTDDKYHWHECTGCEGQQLDKSSHKDLDNNAKCDTCGATVPVGTFGESNNVDTESPDGSDQNNTGTDSGKTNGCGGIIGGASVIVITLAGAGAFFVFRKKKSR